MHKNLVAHRRDEAGYRRYLFAFKKDFLNFIYRIPNSLELSSPV
jgi:hypothetical protein